QSTFGYLTFKIGRKIRSKEMQGAGIIPINNLFILYNYHIYQNIISKLLLFKYPNKTSNTYPQWSNC
ncbi:hypothetical protein, partial [Proteus mirabilis]|uniref:hypothetical protein n=1 Tax=Proteus mirabilis TaxID=584 RepID=UPI001E3A8920